MSTNTHQRATHQRVTKRHTGRTSQAVTRQQAARAAFPGQRGGERRMARRRREHLTHLLKVGGVIIAGVALLAVVYFTNGNGAAVKSGQAGQYRFDVASPGAGAVAPAFTLPATAGSTVSLSDFRGKQVLLFFQEGLGCEGCWTQLKDIQSNLSAFTGIGVDTVVTITTNPLPALKQKVADERLTLPVLSDESFAASRAYNATAYGMMSGSADGHTFILVGPDGRIRWRADYGGPPDYTMYVPVGNLLADIKAGTNGN